jgi:chromate reductase
MVEIGDLPLFNQDLEAHPPQQWVRFKEQVAATDGILFCTPEYNRGVPGVLKNAIDVGSRPYGRSVWDRKPAAIVSASPGAIGGALANHQLRQACVFLNMPVMQQPEAYLGNVTEDSFGTDGLLVDGPLKQVVTKLAHAFAEWVGMIHDARAHLTRTSRG